MRRIGGSTIKDAPKTKGSGDRKAASTATRDADFLQREGGIY
jgi:hypothetical protein